MPYFIVPLLLSLSLFACTAKPVSDYAQGHDFSKYNTFSFIALPAGQVLSIDSKRIETETAAQLNKKGMQQTEQHNADLLVNYRLESETELESHGGTFGFGLGLFQGRAGIGISGPSSYSENRYSKLIIEFINPESKSIIWRSLSQDKLTETMSTQQRSELITKEINLMLNQYPPQDK